MAEPNDTSTFLEDVSAIIQQDYFAEFTEESSSRFGSVTNKIFKPYPEAVHGDGKTMQVELAYADTVRGQTNPLGAMAAPDSFEAGMIKARWDKINYATAHDFTQISASCQTDDIDMEEAGRGSIVDFVKRMYNQVMPNYDEHSSILCNLPKSALVALVNGTPAQNDNFTFASCTGLVLRLIPVSSQCDLTIGTNTEVTIENWNNGSSTSRLLGADGTQTVTLRNCVFPTSGNSPFYDWARFAAYGSSYNGVTYDVYAPALSAPESNRIDRQTTVVTSGSASDVYLFRNRRSAAQDTNTCGILSISAVDTSSGANSATYVYALTGNSNGATNATLTQLSRTTRGTDPGATSTPFSLAADGVGGAAKVQFTRNAAVASVTVVAQFVGLVV